MARAKKEYYWLEPGKELELVSCRKIKVKFIRADIDGLVLIKVEGCRPPEPKIQGLPPVLTPCHPVPRRFDGNGHKR